jgi:hypothetical protein
MIYKVALRAISLGCLLLLCWMGTGCSDTAPPDRPTIDSEDEVRELTTEEVVAGLSEDGAASFCAVGKANDGEQFQLWKTDQNSELYKNGKIQVSVRADDKAISEFNNEATMAVRSVTNRGAVKFYKCPKPMDM